MLKGFKEFAFKGNLIETGIALVMALALAALITSFVENVIMPIVGAVGGGGEGIDQLWTVDLNGSVVMFGAFVAAVLTFLSVAAAVYFFIVKPYEAYNARQPAEEEEEAGPSEVDLLKEIRDNLARR